MQEVYKLIIFIATSFTFKSKYNKDQELNPKEHQNS